MIVTVETLNANGFDISDNPDNQELIPLLVSQYEKRYFDLCLSEGLSDVFTEETKDDERFTSLRESSLLDESVCYGFDFIKRVEGMDRGVNAWIYYHYIVYQYKNVSPSGVILPLPENGERVDPNQLVRQIYSIAELAQHGCIAKIKENENLYPEITDFHIVEQMTDMP